MPSEGPRIDPRYVGDAPTTSGGTGEPNNPIATPEVPYAQYGLAKPRRVLIRGIITHDTDETSSS